MGGDWAIIIDIVAPKGNADMAWVGFLQVIGDDSVQVRGSGTRRDCSTHDGVKNVGALDRPIALGKAGPFIHT